MQDVIELAIGGRAVSSVFEGERKFDITTNIRGRDQSGFVEETQRKFSEEIKLPEGYQVTWGGMFENLERARLALPSLYYLMNRRREEPRDEGGVREPDELPADSVAQTEKTAEEVLAD